MVKIIIAGSRNFEQYRLLELKCNFYLKDIKEEVQIVSGGAKGADLLGEIYARQNSLIVKRFEAEWDKEGKAAGIIRNKKMASYSDYLIAFWDGKSSGTRNMIEEAKRCNLKIRIVKFA